jgi:hypothetical protein
VFLQFDPTLPRHLVTRFEKLLSGSTSGPVTSVFPSEELTQVPPGTIVLSIGDTAGVRALIPGFQRRLGELEPDGFLLTVENSDGVTRIATIGKAHSDHYGLQFNRGTLYGAYASLELLGFAFLHPLEPHQPSALKPPDGAFSVARSPHWPVRGAHLHTMHPIELADVLNGWGEAGIDDDAGFENMLDEWRLYCEWLIANGQNLVEWNLLRGKDWEAFAHSRLRQKRLKALVNIAHEFGIAVGVDVGIVQTQQHNFRLISRFGKPDREEAEIRENLDYLMESGFDFIGTEIGTTEFTSPKDADMLRWIDTLANYLQKAYGKKSHIKVHVSSGQVAHNFTDPRTGEPINYNFLPHFATSEIGVLPHTVQMYGLDDPAPTYGNRDFEFVLDFIRFETGRRDVLWYPETAYWASYDIDVPLFLPVYAERRLHDLRLIAKEEQAGRLGVGDHAGSRVQGQIFFTSGWEWGYWLNDVITARAAFDPHLELETDAEAFKAALVSVLHPFGETAQSLSSTLLEIARDQKSLLIDGRVDGSIPAQIVQRNGQAYMQGWDGFDDLAALSAKLSWLPRIDTQPFKLGFVNARYSIDRSVDYETEVRPLLDAMAKEFARHEGSLHSLKASVPDDTRAILREFIDGARVNALRARQLLGLYDHVDGRDGLNEARVALDEAQKVVDSRSRYYRVSEQRLAGWRENPTAYPFGYLWTSGNLFYWWRDEGKAVQSQWSPCYLNPLDFLNIATGNGPTPRVSRMLKWLLKPVRMSFIVDCLVPPAEEPVYPPHGLR